MHRSRDDVFQMQDEVVENLPKPPSGSDLKSGKYRVQGQVSLWLCRVAGKEFLGEQDEGLGFGQENLP